MVENQLFQASLVFVCKDCCLYNPYIYTNIPYVHSYHVRIVILEDECLARRIDLNPRDIELAAFAPRQKILEMLQKGKGPATNAELVEKCGLTKRKVSYNLSKLAEAGLIEVKPTEKGLKCVSITRKGQNVLPGVLGEKQDLQEVH